MIHQAAAISVLRAFHNGIAIGRLNGRLSSVNGLRSKRFVSWTSWLERYCRVRTVKTRLAATSVIRVHLVITATFFGRLAKTAIYFLVKKTLVNMGNFLFGPLVTVLTGFHFSPRVKPRGKGQGEEAGQRKKMRPWERSCRKVYSAIISRSNFELSHYVTKIFNAVCWISWGCLHLFLCKVVQVINPLSEWICLKHYATLPRYVYQAQGLYETRKLAYCIQPQTQWALSPP